MEAGTAPLLRMEGITKHYGGVRALEDVRFECHAGRIHAVLGENGAGKSTLIKVMSGVVQPDAGVIEFEGTPVVFPDPAAANRAGVVCIFQELSLLPDLTVADNISHHQSAAQGRAHRHAPAERRSPRRCWRASASTTFIRCRWSPTCRSRAARSSRSPRRWRAIRRF